MNVEELKRKFLDNIKTAEEEKIQDNQIFIRIGKEDIQAVSKFIKEQFDDVNKLFEQVFAIDFPDRNEMELIYTWWFIEYHALVHFRVILPYDDLKIKSIQDDWVAANWHERETWEMFGIDFEGHPNLKQFLLSDELFGKHPMRKSFKIEHTPEEAK